MLDIQEGQKVLIIRYGKKPDCIEKHLEVINAIGYCWFGKVGVAPSNKVVSAVLNEDHPKIVLYSQGKGYVADVAKISTEKPLEGYPDYYQEELFDQLIFPKSYFKLTSIEPYDSENLAKITVISSGSPAMETLNKSMASFFIAQYGKLILPNTEDLKDIKKPKIEKSLLGLNECIYRKNGVCTKIGFISYRFECDRPSVCVGQKR